MHPTLLRRAAAFFVPSAAVATITCGLAYAAVQQDLRLGADDPQIQLAEDAAAALDAGAVPASVVGATKVDVATSLAPFVVVFDDSGAVLATDGELDGNDPVPPLGVLESARLHPPDRVTWQPRPGVRVATVTVPLGAGTVLAGRSLREVERREDVVLVIAAGAWLVSLGALAGASLLAAWLWPPGRRDEPD